MVSEACSAHKATDSHFSARRGHLSSTPRSTMDTTLRRRIIRLYRYRCAICDAPGHRVGLDVHHIQPKGLGGSKLLDVPENLIALCRDCHDDVHRKRPRWTARLKTIAARLVENRWHLT